MENEEITRLKMLLSKAREEQEQEKKNYSSDQEKIEKAKKDREFNLNLISKIIMEEFNMDESKAREFADVWLANKHEMILINNALEFVRRYQAGANVYATKEEDTFILTLHNLKEDTRQTKKITLIDKENYQTLANSYYKRDYFNITKQSIQLFGLVNGLTEGMTYQLKDLQNHRKGTPDFVIDFLKEEVISSSIFIEFKFEDNNLTYLQSKEFPLLAKDAPIYILNIVKSN